MAKSKEDPIGESKNRMGLYSATVKRLNNALRRIKTTVKAIPSERKRSTKIQNEEQTSYYVYSYTESMRMQVEEFVRNVLANELQVIQDTAGANYYGNVFITSTYRKAGLEEIRDLNKAIDKATIKGVRVFGLPIEKLVADRILHSQPYHEAVSREVSSLYTSMKQMSTQTSTQVIRAVNAGIQAGLSPTAIAADISERFAIAESSAKRIAVTSVNEAYNNSKMSMADLVAERSGLRVGVRHISALLPTTRDSHSARHEKIYTRVDQNRWWNTGYNRINCHCTVESVLIDFTGKVI